MIPDAWRHGEVAVVGLGRSGRSAALWLLAQGVRVYASDAGDTPALQQAADDLRAAGAAVDVGAHDLARVGGAAGVIVSPGVPPDVPVLAAARNAGVPVLAELDLGARALADTRLVVVTGTNGKTTTTALIAHLMTAAGLPAASAGNIGRPLTALAAEPAPPAWAVVEASSFQLHDAPSLTPAVGVVTNLAPDHLDRYPDVETYYADKARLFANASADSVWVLNGDDLAVSGLAGNAPGARRAFRLGQPADAWYDADAGRLMLDGRPLMPRADLPLLGDHNVANALAAVLAAAAAGAPRDRLAAGLAGFQPIAHRLEPVGDPGGVRWINDSKATNLASTTVALRAMAGPYILILGGRHKGEPYVGLLPLLAGGCRHVIACGEAAARIAEDLEGHVALTRVPGLAEAVTAAAALARPGDTVLLSPAGSSYDEFTDFADRGETFRRLVAAL